MTIRIGLLGLGFMGTTHLRTYARIPKARIVAVCDIDPCKRKEHGSTGGNLGEATAIDLSAYRIYANLEELLQDPEVDVVDITLPTYLHAAAAIQAMEAGKHVICEKPMALSVTEAEQMLAAAQRTGRHLYIAQCIRLWPQYAMARQIVQSGTCGQVRSAVFSRRSSLPNWSWQNWLMDPAKSGGCVLDLHIHDADFILSCFGQPASVTCVGTSNDGRNDHCLTTYSYDDDTLIVAEGAWGYPPSYPFSMTFSIAMEEATLRLDEKGQLTLHLWQRDARPVPVDSEDGYFHELSHFLQCIATGTPSKIIPPESAYQALCLVTAETDSLRCGSTVLMGKECIR